MARMDLMRHLIAVAVGGALAAFGSAALAQTYPTHPIRLFVSFPPGGASDLIARVIGQPLSARLGQPIVIENRPGAGGYLAWNHVAASDPDGYTLLLAENALAISQALYKSSKSNFDPVAQYDAVTGIAVSPSALIVANDLPARTVAELVAHARTVPQKLNFASAGIGSVSHLNFEVFKDRTGMEAVHIPYKGGGQAISDVVAGHVPMTISSVQATKGVVESGQVRALAVTGTTRSPAMPNVPTMQEAGVPPPDVELDKPLQMLVNTLDWSDYVGRIAVGRVYAGKIKKSQRIALLKHDGRRSDCTIKQIYTFDRLGRIGDTLSARRVE